MEDKSINEFIKDFKNVFGESMMFKAVRTSDGLIVTSKNWIEPKASKYEVTPAIDYLKAKNNGKK